MKIRLTQTVELDDDQYLKDDYWANIDYGDYLDDEGNLLPGLEAEEVSAEDPDKPDATIMRIKRTLDNAYKVELNDLKEERISFDDLQAIDIPERTYELVDDNKDEYVEPFGGGTK